MNMQTAFPDMFNDARPAQRELITDSFCGGGGASTGIEMALGRGPDIAVNHDAEALALHAANHPDAQHLSKNIWQVDPLEVIGRRPVGLAWFSPDCKHFSKAKGGKPVSKGVRDLAWVVVLWAQRIRPRVIILENVEEFKTWGPLTEDGRPCPDRGGQTFAQWCDELRRLGYKIEWRELRACDYGAPTIRRRLFVIARRDGAPIIWPEPTHGAPGAEGVGAGRLKPWRTAAEIIDWTLPCPSIFDTSAEIMAKHGLRAIRPLADATMRRIARGVQRYVIDAQRPFCVTYGQHGGASRPGDVPLHTVTASQKDQNAIVVPTLIQTGQGERTGQTPRVPGLEKPIGTQVAAGGRHALVAAFLAQHNGGVVGRPADAPVSTQTTRGTQTNVVAASLINMRGTGVAAGVDAPLRTVTAGGQHAGLVAAFLTKYYGQGNGAELTDPMHTDTTRDRFGLVTVNIDGTSYAIVDIGMRMLTPRERFRAQGFPDSYQIETGRGPDGAPVKLTATAQGRMCGNSVCPPLAAALVRANVPELATAAAAAA
ncbi:MAG: DNA (cytosine-5)-methyltransferase 1 [Paracoccaceae bacterium]|jgi:DNA (cytosine-5)-methyltransferase 1